MERQLALHRPMAAAVKVKKKKLKKISVVKPNVCVVTMVEWKENIDHIPNHEETLHLPLKKMNKTAHLPQCWTTRRQKMEKVKGLLQFPQAKRSGHQWNA